MNQSYQSLSNQIEARLDPERLQEGTRMYAMNKAVGYESENVDEFIHSAMKSVGEKFTAKSIEAGSLVKKHLKEVLVDVDYEYQGSVMTNTHIKG